MALLFMDGFEGRDSQYKYDSWNNGYGGFGTGPATTWVTGRFAGTALNGYNYASQGAPHVTKYLTASDVIIAGIGVSHTNPGSTVNFIRFFTDSASTLQITLQFYLGQIRLVRGASVIGTSQPNLIAANSWGYVEVKAKIDTVNGYVTVKYNGNIIINFTGNTKAAGTSNLIDTFQLYFDGGNGIVADDIYVLNDTGSAPHNDFLGDSRVAAIVPNGAGSVTGFTPSSGANYAAVDEIPPSGADYVESSVSGTKDLYAMSDLVNAQIIYGVQTNVLAQKTDSGDVAVYPLMKVGGIEYPGPSLQMTPSWKMATDIRQINPATATTWTQADVDGLETGVEIV